MVKEPVTLAKDLNSVSSTYVGQLTTTYNRAMWLSCGVGGRWVLASAVHTTRCSLLGRLTPEDCFLSLGVWDQPGQYETSP